jgi:phosphate transport system substrate-binding protein
MRMGLTIKTAVAALVVLTAAGCGGSDQGGSGITVEGSSTVGPFMQWAAEAFQTTEDVAVDVEVTRTGLGLDRFCAGEIDIANASRPIDEDEAAACAENDVEYVQLQVASDALTVAIHTPILYDWVTCLSVPQLRRIWEPDSDVSNWTEVDESFPNVPLELYGADADSGTFDYFTFVINGERGASRSDYSATEDDNDTVAGILDDKGALGYFGFSYYQEHRGRLTALEIDGGDGCVPPSVKTVQDGTYTPLSRPLFIYVRTSSLDDKPFVHAFVRYILENEQTIAREARFVPLSEAQLAEQLDKLGRAASS